MSSVNLISNYRIYHTPVKFDFGESTALPCEEKRTLGLVLKTWDVQNSGRTVFYISMNPLDNSFELGTRSCFSVDTTPPSNWLSTINLENINEKTLLYNFNVDKSSVRAENVISNIFSSEVIKLMKLSQTQSKTLVSQDLSTISCVSIQYPAFGKFSFSFKVLMTLYKVMEIVRARKQKLRNIFGRYFVDFNFVLFLSEFGFLSRKILQQVGKYVEFHTLRKRKLWKF